MENSELAIIIDVRFPDELEEVQKAGGLVIRFTRNPHHDTHESETSLDPDVFDQNKFDFIIHNENMTLEEKSNELWNYLVDKNIVKDVVIS